MQNINSLLYTLEKSIEDLFRPSIGPISADYLSLARGFQDALPIAIQVGEAANLIVEQTSIKDDGDHLAFVTIFLWAEKSKNFFLLWRNVLLQLMKAEMLSFDGEIEEKHLDKLVEV
ncbi:MAG: hypothetical protein OEQ53_22340, partial [Saprospiraceae bacterium]|nr:hypothetical protein [Saprospiraceae bacterium]